MMCSFGGCEREVHALGLCNSHYAQRVRGQDLRPLRRFRAVAWLAEQAGDGCWLWLGLLDPDGYARRGGSAGALAHRWVYELLVGPIPPGYTIDHSCHNEAARRGECAGGSACLHRRCVNPAHLVAVPIGENSLASPLTLNARNRAKQACPAGHRYDAANTAITRAGARRCRACDRARGRRRGGCGTKVR